MLSVIMNFSNVIQATDMKMTRKRVAGYFVGVLVIAPVAIVLLMVQFGYIDQYRSGFYCNDTRISLKFNGDTISTTELMIGAFLIPLIVILLNELVRCYDTERSRWMEKLIVAMWKWYGGYILVLVITLVVTASIKFTVGGIRPHFLETCRPDKAVNCTPGYIEYYRCHHFTTESKILDLYRSFPSGHTSTSVYCALFTFWYIQIRMRSWSPLFISITIQMVVLYFAIICSISRITDHQHHWWDVLAGSILGGLTSILAVCKYCEYFKSDAIELKNREETTNTDVERSYDQIAM